MERPKAIDLERCGRGDGFQVSAELKALKGAA
jgi:hypothetical protein